MEKHRAIKLRLIDDKTRQCTICLCDITEVDVMFTHCGHVSFCLSCCMRAKYLFRGDAVVNCPLCRTQHKSSDVKLMMHTT